MKRKRRIVPLIVTLIAALGGSILRMWSLNAAVDSQGLPTGHISTYLFTGVSLGAVAVFMLLAFTSSGRSGKHTVLSYGTGSLILGMMAAALILVGSGMEFMEALISGAKIADPIMCLLGLVGSICCMVTVYFRHRGQTAYPITELIPIVYLIVKLVLNFKHWSIDPIILDYCVILFALISTLLAFHRGAGFVFDQGKPRMTLFFSMCAVYFCAGAMMEGIAEMGFSTIVTYCGFLLWQLPVLFYLPVPSKADPVPSKSRGKTSDS